MLPYEWGVSDEFRALLQEFVRRFGLLAADRTPCGKPLATSDAHALMVLLEAGDEGILPSVLSARLAIDKSTGTRLAARLIESGHVTSAPSSSDGRARPIRLTRKGAGLAREVDAASRKRFATLLAHVPAARRRSVLAALEDIVGALERMTAEPGDQDP